MPAEVAGDGAPKRPEDGGGGAGLPKAPVAVVGAPNPEEDPNPPGAGA